MNSASSARASPSTGGSSPITPAGSRDFDPSAAHGRADHAKATLLAESLNRSTQVHPPNRGDRRRTGKATVATMLRFRLCAVESIHPGIIGTAKTAGSASAALRQGLAPRWRFRRVSKLSSTSEDYPASIVEEGSERDQSRVSARDLSLTRLAP
jgi:hypothetical protein